MLSQSTDMRILKHLVLALVVLASMGPTTVAQSFIDDFRQGQLELILNAPGQTSSTVTNHMTGGERDLCLNLTNGGPVSAKVELGAFVFQAASGASLADLQWDGRDHDPLLVAETGLGKLNLTTNDQNAFLLGILSLDKALSLTLKVYSSATAVSTCELLLPGGIKTTNLVTVPYSTFNGDADFTQVQAIQLLVHATAPATLVFDFIRTTSPASAVPLDATLTDVVLVDVDHNGKASAGDRLKYVMRIRNPGTEDLTGVEIQIPEIAHTTLDATSIRISPVARADEPVENSTPSQLFHGEMDALLEIPAEKGLLANDFVGTPPGTVTHFGGGALGGTVTNFAAGTTADFAAGSLTVGADGSLTFLPNSSFTGLITFQYRLANAAGTDDALVTLAVGKRPEAVNDTYPVTGNVQLDTQQISSSVLANDQADGVSITVDTNGTLGEVTMSTNGQFVYNPPRGKSSGTDLFHYTIQNGFGTRTSTVTLNITNIIWFVDASAPSGGDGRSHTPYRLTGDFNAINNGASTNPAASHPIILRQGSYSGGINLLSSQKLLGDGTSISMADALGFTLAPGCEIAGFSGTYPIVTASTGHGITLTQSNIIRGLTVGNTPQGFGFYGDNLGGLIITNCQKNGTGGGLRLSNGTSVNVSLRSLEASNAPSQGIFLDLISGSITVTNGSISNPLSAAIQVQGGSVNLDYSGNVSQTNSANLVRVSNGHTGTVNFQFGTLSATRGSGLAFDNADGLYHFNGTNILNGEDAGIDIINGSGGTFNFGTNTSILNPSGTALFITDSSGTITYRGGITNAASFLMDIARQTGGTVTLDTGSLKSTGQGIRVTGCGNAVINLNSPKIVLQTTINNAITLSGNSGTSIQLDAGELAISTTTGLGISASSSGSLSITGNSNVISSAGGIGLNVVDTTIGSNGLNFRSISCNGGSSGVVLRNTGSQGGFSITGAGSANSGGTIQNMTSHGITLDNTRNVALQYLSISGTRGSGIKGSQVTNFTLRNSSIIQGSSNHDVDTSNLAFNDASSYNASNLSGTVVISGNTLQNAAYHGIDIHNLSGTISDLQITNNNISTLLSSPSLGSGIRWMSENTAQVTKATIHNNQIRNFSNGGGILVHGDGTSTVKLGTAGNSTEIINITGNFISGDVSDKMETQGISAWVNGTGEGNFNISNNGSSSDKIRNMNGAGIAVAAFGSARVTATLANNHVSPGNIFASPGIQIGLDQFSSTNDVPQLTATVMGNTINNTDGPGIYALARNCKGTLKAKIQNNTVAAPLTGVRPGIRVDSGSAAGNTIVQINLSGNTSAGSGTHPGIGLRKQGTNTTINTFGIHGLSPSPAGATDVTNYVNSLNPNGLGTLLISAQSGFTTTSLP